MKELEWLWTLLVVLWVFGSFIVDVIKKLRQARSAERVGTSQPSTPEHERVPAAEPAAEEASLTLESILREMEWYPEEKSEGDQREFPTVEGYGEAETSIEVPVATAAVEALTLPQESFKRISAPEHELSAGGLA